MRCRRKLVTVYLVQYETARKFLIQQRSPDITNFDQYLLRFGHKLQLHGSTTPSTTAGFLPTASVILSIVASATASPSAIGSLSETHNSFCELSHNQH